MVSGPDSAASWTCGGHTEGLSLIAALAYFAAVEGSLASISCDSANHAVQRDGKTVSTRSTGREADPSLEAPATSRFILLSQARCNRLLTGTDWRDARLASEVSAIVSHGAMTQLDGSEVSQVRAN